MYIRLKIFITIAFTLISFTLTLTRYIVLQKSKLLIIYIVEKMGVTELTENPGKAF